MMYHTPILYHVRVLGVPTADDPTSDDANFWFNYSLESTEDALKVGTKIYFPSLGILLEIKRYLLDSGNHRRVEAEIHEIVHIITRGEIRQRLVRGIDMHGFCDIYSCEAAPKYCLGDERRAA